MSEGPSKHLTLFSSETENIKKLANLTANTKYYGQITLNTKPHSDPLKEEIVYKCTMRILPITYLVKFSFKRAAFTLEERIPQRVGKRTAIFARNAKTSDQNKEEQERKIHQ